MTSPPPATFKDIERLGAQQGLKWVEASARGEINPPPDFFWLGLVEAATRQADDAAARDDRELAVAWSRVALAVLDMLATDARSPKNRRRFQSKALMLQARLMERLGCGDDCEILDPNTLIKRFRGLAGGSPEVVESSLSALRAREADRTSGKLDDETLRERFRLREIRSAVRALTAVRNVCKLAEKDEAEISRWIGLSKRLP